MNPAALSPPDTSLSAMTMAAFLIGTLAVVFLVLSRRGQEPGMKWLAAGFGLEALWYGMAAGHIVPVTSVEQRLWVGVLLVATMSLAVGVANYLQQSARSWRLQAPVLAPSALVLLALAIDLEPPKLLINLAIMTCYVASGVLALSRNAQEPRSGHAVLGIALLALPGTYVTLLLLHVEPSRFRALGAMPMLVFGIVLLTVSLRRRRNALQAEVARRAAAEAALQEANRTLEDAVAARTAELRELVSSLEGFNRSVSHDLRGPLGGIAGLAKLASEAVASGDLDMVGRSLAAISTQADNSSNLIGALLQLAQVGDAKLARETVALEALAHDVIAQLKLGQPTNTTQWIVGTLPDVEADADLLRPVLVNLMGNALKFSRHASMPTVRIDASVDPAGVTVHVRDNGVGFATDAAAELFQPFMRLHGRRFEGHGIGLSIVRRAVERHGGRVWAEAAPDQGAAFHFTLPCEA